MSTPAPTQKAVIVTSFPGPAALGERPIPQEVGDGEILVKILATALNPVDNVFNARDWSFVQLFPGAPKEESPLVLGSDLAGEVAAVGSGVVSLAVGDKVFAPGAFGVNDTQSHQQYAKVPAKFAAKIPRGVSIEGAATIPLGFITAATGLYLSGGLVAPWKEAGRDAGKAIIILGGSSSVGQFAIQLAKLSGFSPIITTASKQHDDYLKSLGATHVLPYTTSPSELQSITEKPINTIFAAVSTEENIPPAIETLANGGTFIITMPHLVDFAKPLAEPKSIKVVTMFGSPYAPHVDAFGVELYKALTGLLADGSLVPNRVQVFDGGLAGVLEALKLLAQNKVSGVKLVARPQETI